MSDPVFFTEDMKSWINPLPLGGCERLISREEMVAAQKARDFLVPGHASIVRRDAALDAGGLIPELKWYCDWFMNHVITLRKGAFYLSRPMAAMRLSANSYSGRNSVSWEAQRVVLRALMDLLHSPAYADVAQPFAQAGLLVQIGPRMRRYFREDGRAGAFLSPAARRGLLVTWLRQELAMLLPLNVKRQLKKLLFIEPSSYIMP